MGLFKSLVDKLQDKKDELQEKAAKKTAEIALKKSADAARGIVAGAGKRIEEALFGDVEDEVPKAEDEKPRPKTRRDEEREADERKKKLVEDQKRLVKDRAAAAKEREDAAVKLEKDIDSDLAALKRKIAKDR